MQEKSSRRGKAALTRRSFIAVSAATATLPLASNYYGAWAANSENVIKVGFVSPRTGNLGTFGVGDEYLTSQVQKRSIRVCGSATRPTRSYCSTGISIRPGAGRPTGQGPHQ